MGSTKMETTNNWKNIKCLTRLLPNLWLHLSRCQTSRGRGGDFAITLLDKLVAGLLPSVCLNVLPKSE